MGIYFITDRVKEWYRVFILKRQPHIYNVLDVKQLLFSHENYGKEIDLNRLVQYLSC